MRAVVLVSALLLAGCAAPLGAPEAKDVTFEAIRFETTQGTFVAMLFCEETPTTCAFMRELVEGGYYDGRAFGRVIPGFVIQEVDRLGGATDQAERVAGEFGTSVQFTAGALGIARDVEPDSGSSEFFVMDHPANSLYGNYTAFGQVLDADGLDIVHRIARVPAVKTGPASSAAGSLPRAPVSFGVHDRVPVDPVTMTRVTWTNVTLPAAQAAQYPLQASETFRTDTTRSALQWGADLAPGKEMAFTWFTWPRDTSQQGQFRDPPTPTLADAAVDIDGPGAQVHLAGAALDVDAANGAIGFRWTPPAAGLFHVKLSTEGRELAVANLTVAG